MYTSLRDMYTHLRTGHATLKYHRRFYVGGTSDYNSECRQA